MNDGTNPVADPQVLTSWKEIARYMGKGVRTVQRWEQDFGLPVRRPLGSSKKAILARPQDLDAWVALRCCSRSDLTARGRSDGATLHSAGGDTPSPASPASGRHLGALSSLSAQIATSRMLRHSNSALLQEVRGALSNLQRELICLTQLR